VLRLPSQAFISVVSDIKILYKFSALADDTHDNRGLEEKTDKT
jgi:hypothetical protein